MPARERARLLKREALHRKYAEALSLYAETDMALCKIAEACGVSEGGLGNYLRRYWRGLVLRRNGFKADGGDLHSVKIVQAGKQSAVAHAKYKDAVAACDSLDYISMNISQIARHYGLNATSLANFMRVHYPDILVRRERLRHKLCLNDNSWHGARPECVEQYADAVELYRTTDMTVSEIAGLCGVSECGLSQHLRFYHKDLLEAKRRERRLAKAQAKSYGGLLGNGRVYKPSAGTEEKYAEALRLYESTALTMKDIALRTGVPLEGFRAYLHKWHRPLVLERLGIEGDVGSGVDLRRARRRMKTAAVKYADAIESLRLNPRPVSRVAVEFGFNPDAFRDYLHKHEPELASRHGMVRTADGRTVSRASNEKYAEAVRLYATTDEPLRSITGRLGLVYKTVDGFIRRNYPEAVARHKEIVGRVKVEGDVSR